MSPPRPWGKMPLPDEETVPLRLGARDLWLRRSAGELRVASTENGGEPDAPQESEPTPEPPEDVSWSRWALPSGAHESVHLRPAFPDRPVILAPENPFHLVKGARTRVYAQVPVFISVELDMGPPLVLQEIPCHTLSDTWWGTFIDGELGYWCPTPAHPRWDQGMLTPHTALCPLHLRNPAQADLHVQKVALRAPTLTLFHQDGFLWADETKVTYRGEGAAADMEASGRPPPDAKEAELVASPRAPAKGSIPGRTFHRLLNLAPGASAR